MSMIAVGYGDELRKAFAAGEAAATARFISRQKEAARYVANTPLTYDEWIESRRNEPQIARG